MEESDEGNGVSLPPEFKETVKRIRNKEPELETIVERSDKKTGEGNDQGSEQEGET